MCQGSSFYLRIMTNRSFILVFCLLLLVRFIDPGPNPDLDFCLAVFPNWKSDKLKVLKNSHVVQSYADVNSPLIDNTLYF
jgi:hypothetical protein